MDIIELINNDGTSMDDLPKNPLEEKWKELAPIRDDGQRCATVLGYSKNGSPIMNYGCVLCHEKTCQYSDSFVIPDEDKEQYEAYMRELNDYHMKHGNYELSVII